eukprot:c12801_g1_i1.p1 GENE.c12801_g1_i1~~c12801_g1_i1.p1  ORF type:complete len:160 (+),score=37.04 c12801_g1_i1:53-532(+)
MANPFVQGDRNHFPSFSDLGLDKSASCSEVGEVDDMDILCKMRPEQFPTPDLAKKLAQQEIAQDTPNTAAMWEEACVKWFQEAAHNVLFSPADAAEPAKIEVPQPQHLDDFLASLSPIDHHSHDNSDEFASDYNRSRSVLTPGTSPIRKLCFFDELDDS